MRSCASIRSWSGGRNSSDSGFRNHLCFLIWAIVMRRASLRSNSLSSRSMHSGVILDTRSGTLGHSRHCILICCIHTSTCALELLGSGCWGWSYGNMPCSITNSSTPHAQMSALTASYPVLLFFALISCGDMYTGVPICVYMFDSESQFLAKPKSHTLIRGGFLASSTMLSSLRSRCATWFAWRNSTASMYCRKKYRASSSEQKKPSRSSALSHLLVTYSVRFPPAAYSMTMPRCVSVSSTALLCTKLTWPSPRSVWILISCMSMGSMTFGIGRLMNLTATFLHVVRSRHSHVCPEPPSPSNLRTS
mmetsp:Transcript_17161/g.51510  ORF Transcript_17161/g.51510 Transcript_17161/m.51510 type:complete len:306 (-) Transcript_17161:199-1116(-)